MQGQPDLISNFEVWSKSIAAKLSQIGSGRQVENFLKCGEAQIYRTCCGCRESKTFSYRCGLRFCPRCNWRKARERAQILRQWTQEVSQPKHLIVTQRNFEILTRKSLRTFCKNLSRLRRSKLFERVKGGCVSVEITNEKCGWHVHAHWLLDVRWLAGGLVAEKWAKIVGQDFAIVKIKDCRRQDYLHEVAKYVVSGSQIAKWEGEHIWEFICATKGQRFFFPFGTLFKRSAEVRKRIAEQRPQARVCACGCGKFVFEDERQELINEIRRELRRNRRRR